MIASSTNEPVGLQDTYTNRSIAAHPRMALITFCTIHELCDGNVAAYGMHGVECLSKLGHNAVEGDKQASKQAVIYA